MNDHDDPQTQVEPPAATPPTLPRDALPMMTEIIADAALNGPPPGDDPAAATEAFPKVAGYRITGRLGEGGMGVVWRAVQLGTQREVALKFMSAASFGSQRARQRFEREVELSARLEHPGIARGSSARRSTSSLSPSC